MLPFLKKHHDAGVSGTIVKTREPDNKEENLENDGLESCASDLIMAVHAHDIKGVVEALRNAFDILESIPHEESPHTYEDQDEY